MTSFGELPSNRKSTPAPFIVSFPEGQLSDFKKLLALSRIAPSTFENESADGRLGMRRKWLIRAKAEWENWDWRVCERRINSFPNFIVPVEDQGETFDIHFAALFSKKPDAVPVLFLHGWPGSFMEFLSLLDILRSRYPPETLPYHVVVPSLPGYAFSAPPPLSRDFRFQDVASILNTLMVELGFGSGYVVQGGDLGSKIACVMAATYDAVKAVHLNFCPVRPPKDASASDITALEEHGLQRARQFDESGSAYALAHAHSPSTVGLVLGSNPIALLAWIGEKFISWSDEEPPLDDILASVTLYWLTETIARCIYAYRQIYDPITAVAVHKDSKWYVEKPMGYSYFPREILPMPRAWVATAGNLVFHRQHESGGHFAAMERPDVLLEDLEAFISQVWL